jgi:hypothetical protein
MSKKPCKPDALLAGLTGKSVMDGTRLALANEAKILGIGYDRQDGYVYNPKQVESYENQMRKGKDKMLIRKQKQASETPSTKLLELAMEKAPLFDKAHHYRSLDNPSNWMSEKFYKPIHEAMIDHVKQFNNAGDYAKGKKAYDETIKPLVQDLKQTLYDTIWRNERKTGTIDENVLRANLAKDLKDSLGMKSPEEAYYTKNYLEFMEEGGPFYNKKLEEKDPAWKLVQKGIDQFSRNMASFNAKWAMGNVNELYRAFAHYNPIDIIGGFTDMMKASGGKVWGEIPELQSKGIYSVNIGGVQAKRSWLGKADPFMLTVNTQKNLGWYISKRAGENGHEGVKKVALDYMPWDTPMIYQTNASAHALGMTRFVVGDTMQYLKMHGGLIKALKDGDLKQAGKHANSLAGYYIGKAVFTGVLSTLPPFVTALMDDDTKEAIKELEAVLPTHMTKKVTSMIPSVPEGGLDFTEFSQPIGYFGLGGRLASVGSAVEGIGSNTTKATEALQEGDLWKAINGMVDVGMGIGTFGPYGGVGATGVPTSVKKLVDAMTDRVQDDLDDDEGTIRLYEKLFGKDTITKD